MNVSNLLTSLLTTMNNKPNGQNNQIDLSSTMNNTSLKNASELIKAKTISTLLNTLDNIQVEFLETLDTGDALVKLDDNTTFTLGGKLPKNIKKGAIIDILVKNTVNNKVEAQILSVRKPLKEQLSENLNLLKEFDIPTNAESKKALTFLIKNNFPITKDNMTSTYSMIKSEPNIDTNNLKFLISNNVKINENNSEIHSKFINNSNYIKSNLKSLEIILNKEILKDAKIPTDITNDNNNITNTTLNNAEILNTSEEKNTSNNYSTTISNIINEENTNQVTKEHTDQLTDKSSNITKVDDTLNTNTKLSSNDVVQNSNNDIETENTNVLNSIDYSESDVNTIKTSNDYDSTNSKIATTQVLDDSIMPNDSMNDTINISSSNEENNGKLEEFKTKLESLFKDIKHVGNKNSSIKEQIAEVLNLAAEIESNIDEFSSESKELVKKELTEIKENFKLLENMNVNNTIIQLPVQINNHKTSLDLYMFNNKKSSNKKVNAKDMTMFFALDTANLGDIEAFVHFYNNTVDINFCTTKDVVSNLIVTRRDELANMLSGFGFNLIHLSSKVYKKPNNIADINSIINKSYSSFDWRA